MPGPTLLTLRKQVYRRLGENASTRSVDAADLNHVENVNYPLSEVDAAINEALAEIPLRLDHDFFKTSDTVDAVDGEVAVPATYGSHLQLSYRASSTEDWRPLKEYTEERADIRMPSWRTDTATKPTGFFVKVKSDGTICYRLLPSLSATTTSGLLRRYTAKVTALSAKTDTADILQAFPESAMEYVPCRAAAKLDYDNDEGTGRAQYLEAMAEKALTMMRKKLNSLTANGLSNYRARR